MTPDLMIADAVILADVLAATFGSDGHAAIAARGRFTVAIPGGSVASTMFPRLSRSAVDWTRTDFYWVDERAVPPSDPESNYGMARSLWLEPAGVPAERVHRMPADDPDLARGARGYAEDLREVGGDPPLLDFVLLGVGPDGHVASLFPGHAVLRNERDLVAAVDDAPKPPARRLTLTLPVLAAARRVAVVALGASKAPVLHEALGHADSQLPLAVVTRRAGHAFYLIDDAAASLLAPRGRPS